MCDQIGCGLAPMTRRWLIFETDSTETPDVEIDLPTSVAAVNQEGEAVTSSEAINLIQEMSMAAPFRSRPAVSSGQHALANTWCSWR